MTSSTSDIAADTKQQHREMSVHHVVVLFTLMTATLYLAADYSHPHNLQPQSRLIAFAIVITIVARTILREHTASDSAFASRYLLGCAALGMTVLTIRILYPLTSTPDTFNSLINRILNGWLAWPLVALAISGLIALSLSFRARSSLAVYVALILCGSILLSMIEDAQAFLRMVVYTLPLGPRL